MSDNFWTVIEAQLIELRTAKTADDVVRILSLERNPHGPGVAAGDADGFFAGGGGDGSVWAALADAGWSTVWRKASYYWAMQAPNGDLITYVEGDIYRGDRRLAGE